MFIRRAEWGTEHICYSFEEEKFGNWVGILLATSCPVPRKNEGINLLAFLCFWVIVWTDFSSCPGSSLEGSSLILWMLECHQFYLAQAPVEEYKGRHYLSIWMHPGLLRKEVSALPVSAKNDQGELDPDLLTFTSAEGVPPWGMNFLFLPKPCSARFWSLLPPPFSLSC